MADKIDDLVKGIRWSLTPHRILREALKEARSEALKEAAGRNCSVCERYYEHTLCGGTMEKPYRPKHCQFRQAIFGKTKED